MKKTKKKSLPNLGFTVEEADWINKFARSQYVKKISIFTKLDTTQQFSIMKWLRRSLANHNK